MITTLILALVQPDSKVRMCCEPMAAFVADPAFVASHLAPRPLRFAPTDGKTISFKAADGSSAGGYWVPPKSAHSPAIVMIHEWWGLNAYIKREAERLHEKTGYAVLAVDLYDGKTASTPEEAGKYMQSVNPVRANAVVTGAMNGLRSGAFGRAYGKVGTIGWCFGGGWSHRAAIAGGDLVKACVMYYGMPDTDAADLSRLKAPVVMMWATQDKWINESVVDGFKKAMAEAHRPLTVYPYNAGHGFANPSNPVYKPDDAETAMKRSLAFFRKNLGE